MGTLTTLNGITVNASQQQTGAASEMDVAGQVSVCRAKAADLIQVLTELKNGLPGGDPNITTINTLITNLS